MFIDIHSHILPGVDDGAPDLATSLRMAEIAVREGITQMIATPHFIAGDFELKKEEILEKTANLNQVLQERSIDLQILPGEEILITPEVPRLYAEGKLLTLGDGGRYLLLELPMMSIPLYVPDVIYGLRLKGLRPIIAHPERNREIAANPDKLQELINLGALVQVNSLSLTGVYGSEAKEVAHRLFKLKMVHFIASDCHTARARVPLMNTVREIIGVKAMQLFAHDNPLRILEGKDIQTQTDYQRGAEGFLQKLVMFFRPSS